MKIDMNNMGSNKEPEKKTPKLTNPRDKEKTTTPVERTSDKSLFRKFWWVLVIVIVSIFGFFLKSHNNSEQKSEPVKQYKKLEPIKKQTTNTQKHVTDTVNMVPRIQAFFTAYQNFDNSDKGFQADRTKGMMKYAEKPVVEQVLTFVPTMNSSAKQLGFTAEYEVTKKPEVTKTGEGIYNVKVSYDVHVNKHTSKHVDAYTVDTSNNKINAVSQVAQKTE